MKKKYFFKKLMSVLLAAVTMFSLLTLPAHAIVPGEDAYTGQEDGYIYADFVNQSTRYIPKDEIPEFNGFGTYDVLPQHEQERLNAINAQMNIQENEGGMIAPLDVDAGDYSHITPDTYRYSGIVLVAAFSESGIGLGTGFMIDSDNFVTSLHVVFDENESGEYVFPDSLPTIKIYFNVDSDLIENTDWETQYAVLDYLQNAPYVSVSTGMWSSAVNGNNVNNNNYDWFVGKLSSPVTENIYYWNCATIARSQKDDPCYVVGYPNEYSLQLIEARGIIDSVPLFGNLFYTTACGDSGMSGGPVYMATPSAVCYGIAHGKDPNTYEISAVKFYSDLLSAMASFMTE